MPKFSIEKLNEIRKSKDYTLKDISNITEIPLSTISKIFGGFNKNPSIDTVQKIANALDCGIDDFIEYEVEPKSSYYFDRKTAELAQELHDNPEYRGMLKASRDLDAEDLKFVTNFILKIKNSKKG